MGFVSSEGVSVLLGAAQYAADIGSPLTIVPSPQVKRRLELFGITAALNLAPVEPQAPFGPYQA